jgi:hypothetical protein
MNLLEPAEYQRRKERADGYFLRASRIIASNSAPEEARVKMEETAIRINGLRLFYMVMGDIFDTPEMRLLRTMPREQLPRGARTTLAEIYRDFEIDELKLYQELEQRGLHTNKDFVKQVLDAPELLHFRDVEETERQIKGIGGQA